MTWDALDDMENYFLMLGMTVGLQIWTDFHQMGKIFRRGHFLLFCFVRRGVAKRKNGVDVDLI